jgi:hypothetical protein
VRPGRPPPGSRGCPCPPILIDLPGLPAGALAFLPYPATALRPGESVADEVRLTESDVFFAGLLGGPLRRRVSLTTPFPEAGSATVRLATRVLVPVAGRWDEPGLTLRGAIDFDLTQDVDRATGWPRAADGVVKVAGSLLEDDPAERTTADLELRLTLRQR